MGYRPYVDTTLYPPFAIENVPNINYFTLGFVVAGANGEPCWGGYYPTSSLYYQQKIEQVRKNGGDVICSFGGAAGSELGVYTTNTDELFKKYRDVIEQYDFTSLDFDIEGGAIGDWAANKRRAEALKQVQKQYPKINISLTVPVSPIGISEDVLRLVEMTPCSIVNIMAMDYGLGRGNMADYAIKAAKAVRKQTGKSIGITVMIGKNDVPGEVFTLEDAKRVRQFVKETVWVQRHSIWSINRDNGSKSSMEKSSMIDQFPFQFSEIFK